MKKLVIGLTGGYGSGKSTVAAIFKKMGAKVESADEIAHRALQPGTPTYKKILRAFGPKILSANNSLDRAELARIIFKNPSARRKLEKIVHPFVRAQHRKTISQFRRTLRSASGTGGVPSGRQLRRHKRGLLVLEIPLLFEAGLQKLADKIVVVTAPQSVRMRRLASKGVSPADFRRRSRAQWPLARKARLADAVIRNDGSASQTEKQIRTLIEEWFPK